MAPTPAAPPINMRVLGALGPPPPYRPIVQAGAVFERGPPPDLEPWRVASLTRIPAPGLVVPTESRVAGVDPAAEEWSLIRVPEPVVVATPEREQTIRLEARQDFGPIYNPAMWPAEGKPPFGMAARGFPARFPPGVIRPILWAAGLLVTVMVVGSAVGFGRGIVMRAVPGTVRIYAAIGLAAKAPAKCAPRGQPGSLVPSGGQDTKCEASPPPVTTK